MSPIIGLTDTGAKFPRIGVLRKGAPKEGDRAGRDLKYFRFTSDDTAIEAAFATVYGKEPTDINVYLPFATVEENLEAWYEEWGQSALKHRCDGERCVVWLDEKSGKYHKSPPEPAIPCPHKGEKNRNHKPVGRLTVIVPELKRFAYITVQTTSIHDIMELTENLRAAMMIQGSLMGIPFVLRRRPRMVSTPMGEGKRARVEKWLLSLEPAPRWVALKLADMDRAYPALPAGDMETPEGFDNDDDDPILVDPKTGEIHPSAVLQRKDAEGPKVAQVRPEVEPAPVASPKASPIPTAQPKNGTPPNPWPVIPEFKHKGEFYGWAQNHLNLSQAKVNETLGIKTPMELKGDLKEVAERIREKHGIRPPVTFSDEMPVDGPPVDDF